MSERTATRVVLLARDGKARERLGAALDAAGAELALVADPLSADPGEAIAARPQAVLVALEPAVEDALERFDALLSDPSVTVVFEEAELAAQRDGWDAARWVRHLSAKLNHHDDVLPPGWDDERDLQPSPGALPQPAAAGLDIATFAGEAEERAADVPRDELPPEDESAGVDVSLQQDAGDLRLEDLAEEAPTPIESGYELADAPLDAGSADDAAFGDLRLDDIAVTSEDTLTFEAVPGDGFGIEGLDEDAQPAAAGDALEGDFAFATGEGFELDEAVPLPGADESGVEFAGFGDDGASETPAEPRSTLDLVDVDALLASVDTLESRDHAPAPPAPAAPDIDLDALERRVSGLSLADVDSYGHGPERGAVVVEGGLGGPDAVRQLLAAMPGEFPRPVLVRLQLDGGRYDRLVRQMERAAQLPVALAEVGQSVEAGTIYFVPPTLSIQRERGRLAFVADEAGARPLLAALPAGDSAVLLMSGSTAASAEAAAAQIHAGLLAAAQALDGCYDPTATHALAARGGDTGTPVELAERLAARWPS
jgi:chemosensory pili system protein ChpB (putative protein-glutamate methylesterase)